MPKISVILPVLNDNKFLPKALDSLIYQTAEDFEVIIIDGGSADGSIDTARDACNKYVGFYLITEQYDNRFFAYNRGLKAAEGDYVIFLSAKDFITDETIEELIKKMDECEKTPDILVYRNYVFGENIMPFFDEYDDKLAPLPSVPKYDNLCLRAFNLGNKCYRKAFLENKKIYFGTDNTYEDFLFVYKAFIFSKFTVGCPHAFYEKRINGPSEGFDIRKQPTEENFIQFNKLFSDIYNLAAMLISNDTSGYIDGTESYLQEVNYRYVCMILEMFYSFLWFMDDKTYSLFTEEYNTRLNHMNKEKIEKLKKMYLYLGAPFIFESKQKVDYLCLLIIDFKSDDEYTPFLDSLYHQNFPFFEVAIKKEIADKGVIPEIYLNMDNLKVISGKDYFSNARSSSNSRIVLILKDGTPLHSTVLKEFSESNSPLFLRQAVFSKIRKSKEIRRTLKEKGLDI